MGATDNRSYLGKRGKVHGPYTPADLERLHASGEIHGFTYIWRAGAKEWEPIEEPPPPPEGEAQERGHARSRSIWNELEALCHDGVHIVSGTLSCVTDLGCELSGTPTSATPEDLPRLAVRSPLVLNLLDPKRGKAMNVRATLAGVARENGKWIYRLSWDQKPEL